MTSPKLSLSPVHGVREKRYTSSSTSNIKVRVDGSLCQVKNISDTGAAFWSEIDLPESKESVFALAISDNAPLNLKGRIIWKRAEEGGFLYGFHFNHVYLPEGFLEAIDKVDLIKEGLQQGLSLYIQVGSDFRILTYEIKYFLGTTKTALDGLESEILSESESTRNSYKEVILAKMEPDFVSRLKDYSRKLDQLFSQVTDRDLRKQYIAFFRAEVGSYYTQNPFIGRALRKPRGYAGDYEMMNQIYRDSFEGNSLFEMMMHRYGIHESSSLSVKFRKKYLADKITNLSQNKSEFTVASIASGPAQEIIQFLDQVDPDDSGRYNFVLVDQDIEALLNSKRNINEKIIGRNLKCQAHFLPIAVKDIIENTTEAKMLTELRFDLIYTAGLYDYLTQPVAQILTHQLSLLVKSQGHLIIGNFHPNNPTKTISELVADWRLIHRSRDEMIQLTKMVSYQDYVLNIDELEIDWFLEVKVN
ncbi:MAG: PilZ domain-containing protein [Bdellovibrionaceae bacterium]|nr:PilZ domain-containing protein [Pseudobdellovibrionaceae bacterium]